MKRKNYKTISNSQISVASYQRSGQLLLAIPVLAVLVVLLLLSYMVMTTLTVFNTAERANYEKKISLQSASIANLESKLSLINKNITPVLATTKGFQETKSVKYVTVKPIRSAMSGNEMEF